MQKNIDWQYLNNQFENALRDSYRSTLVFMTDHAAKLQNNSGEPQVGIILSRTTVCLGTYQEKMANWQKANAFWKGATNKTDGLLAELLQTKIARWEHRVLDLHNIGTPEYITLFPNGRTGFREGGKDIQIQTLKAFVHSLSEYPAFIDLRGDVELFYNTLLFARSRQQQREQEVRNAATELREAQDDVFNILYANLGFLMNVYYKNTAEILNYFQVELIRNVGTKKKIDETEDIEPLYDAEDEPF